MAFAYAESRQDAISDMNITPLVDVMLVMLVIFMITAPVFSRAIPMNLPGRIGHGEPPPPIELRIDATGEIFLGGQMMPVSALSSVFSAELERAAQQLGDLGGGDGRHPRALRRDLGGLRPHPRRLRA